MPPHLNEQNKRIEPNNKLSEMDKAFMIINYPPFAAEGEDDPFKRDLFEDALDTVGVVDERKVKILKLYDSHLWLEVRYEFNRFSTDTRLARKAAMHSAKNPAPSRAVDSRVGAFTDGCLAEDEDEEPKPDAAKGLATVDAELWLPGDTITYSFIQGSTNATEYRRKRVKETFDYYSSRANIKFNEIPFEPKAPEANIRIYFGVIPKSGVAAWCKIGKLSIGFRQTQDMIDKKGGTVVSTFVISDLAVPKVAPTNPNLIKQDTRTLYHEIGHALGLKHEHVSPYTMTTDKPDPHVSAATIFDDNSVMLYAGRKLRATPGFSKIKDNFDPGSTKYNHVPSEVDLAFLGVSHTFVFSLILTNDAFHRLSIPIEKAMLMISWKQISRFLVLRAVSRP